MRKKHTRRTRSPRTTQEKRVNGKRSKWARGKRTARNLIDAWDDKPHCIQKTWKVKRRHQYRGRGKQHTVFLPAKNPYWMNLWNLEEYFEEHNIPYRLEKVAHVVCRYKQVYKWKIVRYEPYSYVREIRKKKTETKYETVLRYKSITDWVKVPDKYRKVHYSTLLGHKIVWWSDKDIGIDFILKQFNLN